MDDLVISLRAIDDATYHGAQISSMVSRHIGQDPSYLELAMLLCALVVEFSRADSNLGELTEGSFAHLVAQSYDTSLSAMRDHVRSGSPRTPRQPLERMRAEFRNMLQSMPYEEAVGQIVGFLRAIQGQLRNYAQTEVPNPESCALLTLFA